MNDCTPYDSDECIKNSPSWGDSYTCDGKDNTYAVEEVFCNSYPRDARRCCPETCENAYPFTKTICDQAPGYGDCNYPTDGAQCEEGNTEF